MKTLLLADTHGTQISYVTTERNLEEEDIELILLAGDFSYFEQRHEPMLELLQATGIPVFFTSGNHESTDMCRNVAAEYGFRFLDGESARFGEFLLVGLAGYDIFYPTRSTNLLDFYHQSFEASGATCKILISHEPPYPWLFQGRMCGSPEIADIIERHNYDLVVTGHLHSKTPRMESMGSKGTPVINPGTRGTVFDCDTRQFCRDV